VYGVLLRAIEQERKQAEFEELRQEMNELRELFEENQRHGEGGSW